MNFALRVGVNTGEVVAGAVGDGYTVIGDTVNVAARLQSAARPGSVTVGERTYRATMAGDRVRAARALTLKGRPSRCPPGRQPACWPPSRAAPGGRGRRRWSGATDKLELLESVYSASSAMAARTW